MKYLYLCLIGLILCSIVISQQNDSQNTKEEKKQTPKDQQKQGSPRAERPAGAGAKTGAGAQAGGPGKQERPQRPDRPDRPDKPERPERPDRPDGTQRPERPPQRPDGRQQRPDRPDQQFYVDQGEYQTMEAIRNGTLSEKDINKFTRDMQQKKRQWDSKWQRIPEEQREQIVQLQKEWRLLRQKISKKQEL